MPERKAYALLTIPGLHLTWTVEARFVTGAFPLRATDYLATQLNTFLRPSVEDERYSNIHGPANVLRRSRLAARPLDTSTLVSPTPVLVRQPVLPERLPGPGHSTTRGYKPSAAGLRSVASQSAAPPSVESVNVAAAAFLRTFTSDELAARTPRTIFQALNGAHAIRPILAPGYPPRAGC